ncbi:MAG: hypothetical protein WA096_01630 [Smithella sp.]
MSELRVMSLPPWIPASAGMTSGLSLCMVLKILALHRHPGIPEHAPGFPAGLRCQAVGGHKSFKETFNLG